MEADERECPFRAEIIKAKAKVCRYCGKELSAEGDISAIESSQKDAPQKTTDKQQKPLDKAAKPKGKAKNVLVGCVTLIIIAFIAIGVIGYFFRGKKDDLPPSNPAPASSTATPDVENGPLSPPTSETMPAVAPAAEDKASRISDPVAAEKMLQKLKEAMHIPDLNATVDDFSRDTITVSITLPYNEELPFSSAVALGDSMAYSISKWRRSESVWGDYMVTVRMLNERKDADADVLGAVTYTSETDISAWTSAPGKPEGKTEDQEWIENQPVFKKALIDLFADGSMKDIDFEITEFTPRDIAFRAVLPRPINNMEEAEIIGKATVITAVQWSIAEGVNPAANDMDIRGRVVIREKGVTGQDLIRYYGTARYSKNNDQVTWRPEGR